MKIFYIFVHASILYFIFIFNLFFTKNFKKLEKWKQKNLKINKFFIFLKIKSKKKFIF